MFNTEFIEFLRAEYHRRPVVTYEEIEDLIPDFEHDNSMILLDIEEKYDGE